MFYLFLTFMTPHVVLELQLLLEGGSAQVAGMGLVSGVGPSDVAVVRGVGGEGLPAVLALEGPLSGVLPDVCSQDAGGSEGLEVKRRAKLWCFHSDKKGLCQTKGCIKREEGRI